MKPSAISTTWYYDDAAFHGDRSTLYVARLQVFADGTAEVAVEDSYQTFPSEDEARIWLTSEEFDMLDTLEEKYGLKLILPARG